MGEIIPHWLTKQAFLSPNELAIELKSGEQVTFSQLKERSQKFAKQLARQGVRSGDHIGIYSTNCLEMIIALHAISYIGAVAVLLNIRLTKKELEYQLTDANVTLFPPREGQLSQTGNIESKREGSSANPPISPHMIACLRYRYLVSAS